MARQRRRSSSRPQASRPPSRSLAGEAKARRQREVERRQLGRPDARNAALVALAAFGLYLTTLSSHVALGDAPESVAGVRALGILHAPGYPAYVLSARLFGTVLPIGSWALRVNVFSAVCAALTVGCVYAVARGFGASGAGAAVGSLALGSAASFWLNATFAKYYAPTASLLAASTLCVVLWQQSARQRFLIAAAVLLGAALGSGWQLAIITIVALAVMLWLESPRPDRRTLAIASATLLAVAIALWGFVLIRAGQDPRLNWGEATNPGRLWALIARKDFASAGVSQGPLTSVLSTRLGSASGGLIRDFGAGAALLALAGIVAWRRLYRSHRAFLAIVFVLNVLAVAVVAGLQGINGFHSVVAYGGYLLLSMIALAVLAAIGTTVIVDAVGVWLEDRSSRAGSAARLRNALALLLAAAAIVPSVVVHRDHANLRVPPFADAYARRVLRSLPPHAALVVWGEEFAMPMIYAQVVDHVRPDVDVITGNVNLAWARVQLQRRYHLGRLDLGSTGASARRLVAELFKTRKVYLDVLAMLALEHLVGYTTHGFVAEVVRGRTGPHLPDDPDAISAALRQADRADHLDQQYDRFPFRTGFFLRDRTHVEMAKVYLRLHRRADAVRELERAAKIYPYDVDLHTVLREGKKPGADLGALLAHI